MERIRVSREMVVAAVAVAVALGVGSLVLQRWVAETRNVAIAMVAAWYALVLLAALVFLRDRTELRRVALATVGAIAIGTLAVGYWTGFRDVEVDEDVVVAATDLSGAEREAALAGGQPGGGTRRTPAGPEKLAAGSFEGVDGHTGRGTATLVRQPDGKRVVTFTDFDVDPGPGVVVYLTRDESGPGEDYLELGDLKGNVGDQQYEIPDDANLGEFDTVMLWCVPFTTRIAVAPLR